MNSNVIEFTISEDSLNQIRNIIESALEGHKTEPMPHAEEKPYLTTKEAERFSGYSSTSLYTYKCRGILTPNKNRGKVLWPRTELLKLMGVAQ